MVVPSRGETTDPWRVLVVEQDFTVGGLVRYALGQQAKADVEVVGTTQAALEYLKTDTPDLIVLDVSRSFENTLDMCGELGSRSQGVNVPIIVTSPRFSEADRVLALDLGADDCLTRPFGPEEFAARARAVTRKRSTQGVAPTVYRGSHLVADFARVSITVDGKPVRLTRREFGLLQHLIARPNRVLSREQLINRLWPEDTLVTERTVDAHMGRLRAKLGPAASQIETVFGIGYRFVDVES